MVPPTRGDLSLNDLERIDKLLPETRDRVLIQWERNQEYLRHRGFYRDRTGMTNARLIAMVALLGSIGTIALSTIEHFTPGAAAVGAIGTVDLVALVYVFLTGQRPTGTNPDD